MGVKGLWPILNDCARPTPLPTLNRKRLAVDASIWIYQFLKAVRDKEGNALRNSHIVGFFRRICKLLYFGIKPVFVFDGVAPALKKQTIQRRKQRREGRRDDATRTAAKLLTVHMQRRGEEETARRRKAKARENEGLQPLADDDEAMKEGEEIVYADEMGMSAQQRLQTRKFKKTDAYHLPDLDVGIEEMRRADDVRFRSIEELEEVARQSYNGEELKHIDFSSIDFNGDLFKSLPKAEQYSLRNAARLKSRQRMGFSKEALDEMYPNRMDFSKRQIERVIERNELTQGLMKLAGMEVADTSQSGYQRIAASTGREYRLEKTEHGYGLGVAGIDKSAGDRNKPIEIDDLHRKVDEYQKSESEEEFEFEDVPVEGLNRLPKGWTNAARVPTRSESGVQHPSEAADTLFVDEAVASNEHNVLVEEEDEELSRAIALSLDNGPADEDLSETEHVNRAIALSLESNHRLESDAEEDDDFEDVPLPEYKQVAVQAIKPFATSSKSQVAHIINNRANAAVPGRKAVDINGESDSDDMDLQTSLAKARRRKAPQTRPPQLTHVVENKSKPVDESLPFKKMDFKSSIFGSNAEPALGTEHVVMGDLEIIDEEAGGFEKDALPESKPLPPWLTGSSDIRSDVNEQQKRGQQIDAEDKERADEEDRILQLNNAPIEIESSDGEDDDVEMVDAPTISGNDRVRDLSSDIEAIGATSTVQEPDIVRQVTPEKTARAASFASAQIGDDDDEAVNWSESDHGDASLNAKTLPPTTTSATLNSPPPALNEFGMDKLERPGSAPQQVSESNVEYEDMDEALPQPEASAQSFQPTTNDFENAAEARDSDSFDEFDDPDDEALLAQLAIEAETHEEFAKSINSKTPAESQAAYKEELKNLRNQQKKDRRDADEVTSVMNEECQKLLQYFGLPYIIAPGEAEAQCAELVHLELVDGVVTDDCDIFLFGGTRVYKNLFNSNKDVECYLQNDIEKELSLGRDQLIALAQLLGSDYAEGLHGVGSVTAIELISEFPTPNTGLQEFKDWWTSVQNPHPPPLSEEPSTFRKKFRRTHATKLFLPAGFPSSAVNEAYLKPLVDNTKEEFVWGVPDLVGLREFLMQQIGWTQERVDEVLVPVIKDMNQRELEGTQSNITRYFQGTVGAGAKTAAQEAREGGSKRMKDAVNKLKGKKKSSLTIEERGTFADIGKKWAKNNPVGKEDKPNNARKKKRPAAVAEENEEHIAGDDDVENSVGQQTGTDNDVEAQADDESGSHDEDDYREPSVAAGKRKQKPKIPARQPKKKKVKT